MPRPLTTTQRDTVASMLAAERPQIEIAEAANCSVCQSQRIKRNVDKWGITVDFCDYVDDILGLVVSSISSANNMHIFEKNNGQAAITGYGPRQNYPYLRY